MGIARIKDFKRGLWISGSKETSPEGTLRRFRGVGPIRESVIRSRNGSTLLHALTAHSLFRYGDLRFVGSGADLYRNGVSIKTGLSGGRLAFAKMPPQPDLQDYLFVAGGGSLFKVDPSGVVSNWGIAAPPDGFTAAAVAAGKNAIDPLDSAASWTGTSATLANEASIKQEGTNALKMTVLKSTIGYASKAIAINLSTFPDESYISFWVRIDNPLNVDYLHVILDVGDGSFNTDAYSRIIRREDFNLPVGPAAAIALGFIDAVRSTHDILDGHAPSLFVTGITPAQVKQIEANPYTYLPSARYYESPGAAYDSLPAEVKADIMEELSTITFPSSSHTWTKIRIPKKLFSRTGAGTGTWANVAAVRLVAKTNGLGSAVIYLDDLAMTGDDSLIGTYSYRITYKNSITGSRSNANPTAVIVSNIDRQRINLTNLPVPTDPQVNTIEIYRTLGGGNLHFKAGEVALPGTTFNDNVADYTYMDTRTGALFLQNVLLLDDNIPPEPTYNDAVSHNSAMFWTRDSTPGARGRVYYSPVGRPESASGFLEITSDDDAIQKIVRWNQSLWAFSESRIFQILGTDPYISREVFGSPGTRFPFTVQPTPFGILYSANDGIRLFNGATSSLIAFDPIGPILRGRSTENLTSLVPTIAAYGNGEYILSDGAQTLSLLIQEEAWRDIGIGLSALFYEDDTGSFIIGYGTKVLLFEVAGVLTDDGVAIPFAVEFPSRMTAGNQDALLRRLILDLNTNGETLTPTLLLDGAEIIMPLVTSASRARIEYAINRRTTLAGVRLTGSLSNIIELHGIELDIYIPATQETSA